MQWDDSIWVYSQSFTVVMKQTCQFSLLIGFSHWDSNYKKWPLQTFDHNFHLNNLTNSIFILNSTSLASKINMIGNKIIQIKKIKKMWRSLMMSTDMTETIIVDSKLYLQNLFYEFKKFSFGRFLASCSNVVLPIIKI